MTTEKWYTLRELADEHGLPVRCESEDGNYYTVIAFTPMGKALGHNDDESFSGWESGTTKIWCLAKKQRVAVEFLYGTKTEMISHYWKIGAESDCREWCDEHGFEFLKILRTEVIE